jgi:hypothetical protein
MASTSEDDSSNFDERYDVSFPRLLLSKLRENRLGVVSTLAARYFCDNTVSMRRQSVITRKKRGPPATGKGELIGVRIQPNLVQVLDRWIAAQLTTVSRPEAIRQLIERALATATPSASAKAGSRRKAAEMAGQTIDQLADQTATDEQRAGRKRRLVKGPREFRDMRGDQPKDKG